jgi:ParB-like chromosome segregation protein Spo0J
MKIESIKIDDLKLDSQNPRLTSSVPISSQFDLLKMLYTEMSIDEIALSIAENGYFSQEPLFVIKDAKEKGRQTYAVIEGNRRLAAVKLLCDDALRTRINATDLPVINASAKAKLKELPCVVYSNRRELWQFLGFRHINGVKPWDAYSKANYVAEVHEKYKIPLDEIAQRIGDRHTTVKRLYRGLTVLRQAEKQGFNREDRARNRFYFSHLYTALDQPEFQKFLTITSEKSLRKDPVPPSKKRELKELMVWLYGSRAQDREPVVRSQNPDLNRLREIISEPRALAALRRGTSIERSHEISIGDERRFSDAVYGALEDLKQANGLFSSGFRDDERLRNAVDELVEQVSRLKQQITSN